MDRLKERLATANEPLTVTIYGRLAAHAVVMARWLDTAEKNLTKRL